MGRASDPLPPEELLARTGREPTPPERLAAFEAADASQQRPKKVPCVWDRVCFMEWETWRDLGLSPPAGEERFGNRLRKDERGRGTR